MITNLATKRLVLAVSTAQPDELDSAVVDAVEEGFGARVGVGGLAGGGEGLVDCGGVVACGGGVSWMDGRGMGRKG